MSGVKIGRGKARHRPRHARPSLLAPRHRIAGLGGLALLAALCLAMLAALVRGPAGPTARAAVPAPVRPANVSAPAQLLADGPPLAPADRAALASTAQASPDAASSSAPSVNQPPDTAPASALAADGIPVTALQAYQDAAAREARRTPGCGLTWPLLAGIGRVESDHGRFAGAVLHSDGLSTPRVIGIPLNGHGTALIMDTDGGRLDGDTVYDRAVGPMQFIPSTWAGWGVDANGDGLTDPFNVFDAAAAAADYLCAAGRDLTTSSGQVRAILSYNYSWDYVHLVMSLEKVYAAGVGITVPVLPTSPEPRHGRPAHKPQLPPVDPGKPRGTEPPKRPPHHAPTSSPVPTRSASTPPPSSSSAPPNSATSSSAPPNSAPPNSAPPGNSTSVTPSPSNTSTTAPSSPAESSPTAGNSGSGSSSVGKATSSDPAPNGSS